MCPGGVGATVERLTVDAEVARTTAGPVQTVQRPGQQLDSVTGQSGLRLQTQ